MEVTLEGGGGVGCLREEVGEETGPTRKLQMEIDDWSRIAYQYGSRGPREMIG